MEKTFCEWKRHHREMMFNWNLKKKKEELGRYYREVGVESLSEISSVQ